MPIPYPQNFLLFLCVWQIYQKFLHNKYLFKKRSFGLDSNKSAISTYTAKKIYSVKLAQVNEIMWRKQRK